MNQGVTTPLFETTIEAISLAKSIDVSSSNVSKNLTANAEIGRAHV
jgi:hypothetical protein